MKPMWERRYERKAARRYMHMTPWRRCRVGFCLRCWRRELAGINRRAKAEHIRHVREDIAPTLSPVQYQRDEDGHWRRAET